MRNYRNGVLIGNIGLIFISSRTYQIENFGNGSVQFMAKFEVGDNYYIEVKCKEGSSGWTENFDGLDWLGSGCVKIEYKGIA